MIFLFYVTFLIGWMQPAPLAGTATSEDFHRLSTHKGCNPHPSRGRQPRIVVHYITLFCDATRTPRGDGNQNRR